MEIVVAMRQIADLVEELEVADSGTDIDREFVKFVSNEWDEAALEEALCLKDEVGGRVTVIGIDEVDFDQSLYAALAKGADQAVKLMGNFEGWVRTSTRAEALASWLSSHPFDILLTGVQAADDLDGQLAGVLGARLGLPHAAVVTKIVPRDAEVEITQETGGGVTVSSTATTPVVLGIQAARQAPRYVPISRIRQAMTEGGIEEVQVQVSNPATEPKVIRLYPPESKGNATMLSGKPSEVAERIIELIKAKGLIHS